MVLTRETLDSKHNSTKVTVWKIYTMPIVTISQSQNGYTDVRQSDWNKLEMEYTSNDKGSVCQGDTFLCHTGSLMCTAKQLSDSRLWWRKFQCLFRGTHCGDKRMVAHAWMAQLNDSGVEDKVRESDHRMTDQLIHSSGWLVVSQQGDVWGLSIINFLLPNCSAPTCLWSACRLTSSN